jgi:hypothetical protein
MKVGIFFSGRILSELFWKKEQRTIFGTKRKRRRRRKQDSN